MASLDFQHFVRSESARFAEVVAGADASARVPSCPDWDVADLVWHLAEVQLFWAVIVRDRLDDPTASDDAKPPRPDDYPGLLKLFDSARASLLDALAGAPDDTAVWTWGDDHTAGFVRRRQAHEALIHRLDAELATGAITGIDARLASDGVDEVLRMMYSGYPDWADYAATGAIGRLRTSDTGAQWLVELGDFSGTSPNSGKSYAHRPVLTVRDDTADDPTFTITGPARDLDAWLWNRPTLSELEISGDRAGFDRLRATIADGIN